MAADKKTKVQVKTHDGESYVVEIENYDAKELARRVNDQSALTVQLGDAVEYRANIKSFRPVSE